MSEVRGQKSEARRRPKFGRIIGEWFGFWFTESGGERAAVQTLREVWRYRLSASASGLRLLQHRFDVQIQQEDCFP
jgi:hypothetical protein